MKRARLNGDCPAHMLVSLVTFLLLASIQVAHAQFEGIVESNNLTIDETGSPQKYVMTMWIKTNMVKVKTASSGAIPSSTMIYRNDKRTVWVLNDEDKTYFEIPQSEQAQNVDSIPKWPPPDDYEIQKSGKKKKILGYACEQVFIKRADQETEIWGTKELVHLFRAISKALGDDRIEDANDWTDEIMKMGLFPLISSTKIEGNLVESQEVTRIEHLSLSQEMFELPVGYRKENPRKVLRN